MSAHEMTGLHASLIREMQSAPPGAWLTAMGHADLEAFEWLVDHGYAVRNPEGEGYRLAAEAAQ